MAKSSSKSALFLNLVLMLSLLLIINMVESRLLIGIGFGNATSTPVCDSVFGARPDDNCFNVPQIFNLTAEFFLEINPNINCEKIFVGQWLCVKGSVN